MVEYIRKKRSLHLPITLSVALLTLNITLMVCWIVILSKQYEWEALTVGTVAFSLMLVGISIYLVMTVKEVRLNQRQANFVDSVTHELKSPIAALKLYLDTLKLREMEIDKRDHFYDVMGEELERLDRLINQLLEVGRLDAIGHESEEERVMLDELIRKCATTAAAHHKVDPEIVFHFELAPLRVNARRVVLEMIFGNLLDNGIKYGGTSPRVDVSLQKTSKGRILATVGDSGEGVSSKDRKKIFKIFYRGGNELERRSKGTGLGLYIVRTLVYLLGGKVSVNARSEPDQKGSVFEIELPEKMLA